MVGADGRDVAHPRAELELIVVRTKWWRAFRDSAEAFHILIGQDEVMRTGFAGHVDSSCARFSHERDYATATDVDDVKPAAGFRGDIDRATDRFELGCNRSRVQEIADAFLAGRASGAGQLARHLFRFGVDSDE